MENNLTKLAAACICKAPGLRDKGLAEEVSSPQAPRQLNLVLRRSSLFSSSNILYS
jgi:hypothetical protein